MTSSLKRLSASVQPLVWVLLLTFACLLPFANKAFHIDDTLFLSAAAQIQKHPADFYGFNINWSSTTTPMTEVFENPPLTCYYIALVASIFGWSELALHLAFLLPALAAAWGTFRLANYFCEPDGKSDHAVIPALAAVIAVLTPVFLISATTLMCDVMLVAFWVWSLVLFEKGLRLSSNSNSTNSPAALRAPDVRASTSRLTLFLCSGLLAGLAVLTKFMGLALVPLLVAYGILRSRRPGSWMLAPLLPMLFAAGYEWLAYHLYGHGMFLHAARFTSQTHNIFSSNLLDQFVRGLIFTGGCFLPILFFAPWLWTRRSILISFVLLIPLVSLLPFLTAVKGILWTDNNLKWMLYLQTAMFLVSGIHILLLLVWCPVNAWIYARSLSRRDESTIAQPFKAGDAAERAPKSRRDGRNLYSNLSRTTLVPGHPLISSAVLLLLWGLGIFVFGSFINWTLNGRSLLPMAPALGILVAQRLAMRFQRADGMPSSENHANAGPSRACPSGLIWPALAAATISLMLAKADYDLAGAGRSAAKDLVTKYQARAKALWFEGHWGFQYYMEQLGAKPLDFIYHKLVPGEFVILPAPNSFAPALPSGLAKLAETTDIHSTTHCSTMTYSGTAAFYCALFGPLPFEFGNSELASFSVYEVIRPDEAGEVQQLAQGKPTEQELTRLEALLKAHPNDAQAHFQLANLLSSFSRNAEAIEHYRTGLHLKPDSAEALNNLAWILATDADARLRDGPQSIRLADQACELTGHKTAQYLGTLAAAYAEAGRFAEAIAAADRAIAIAETDGHPDLAETNRKLREFYRNNRSYHQLPTLQDNKP